jgi:hypothetical protein
MSERVATPGYVRHAGWICRLYGSVHEAQLQPGDPPRARQSTPVLLNLFDNMID